MIKVNHPSYKGIRIIGGKWRGRKLLPLKNSNIRPTLDRMRETLFNWLSFSIINARCLDCFAGSGILGIEALSRHADNVTFLEKKHNITKTIQQNLNILKAINAKVVNTNTLDFLMQPGKQYNVVFVDPPFRKGLLHKTLILLEKNNWLTDESFIYIENEIEYSFPLISKYWNLYRKKSGKKVAYSLFFRKIK